MRARGAAHLLPMATAVAVVAASLAWVASPARAVTQTYAYTGGPQIYVVPPGVTSIAVTLSGAQGDSPSGGGTGGLGGSVSATVSVTPGEVLQVMVGGSGAAGGFNGGGRGAGTGGGASDVRRPAFSTSSSCAYQLNCGLSERIVVAGGGGGGGNFSSGSGGSGGQTATAGSSGGTGDATGGGAGTTTGGSAGAGTYSSPGSNAAAGAVGIGGASAWVAGATGGGGGGGYFGGGGGGVSQDGSAPAQADGAGGGGGGSSWAGGSGVSGATLTNADRSGNGVITIDPPSAITDAAFGPTGGVQHYTADSDVTELAFRLYGGAGFGSEGDIVSGRLPVTVGQVLEVNIGGRGLGFTETASGWTGGTGGWNGGGDGIRGMAGGGGGGASDIRICAGSPSASCSLSDRVIVAGGGGGSGTGAWGCGAGFGGVGVAGDGGNGACNNFGTGGSLTAPGTGGAGTPSSGGRTATSGTLGNGGRAGADGTTSAGGAGGGGGGYYGAGGGYDAGGGGGGSSYASVTGRDATNQGVGNVLGQAGAPITHAQGGNSGDGMAVITAMPIGVTSTASGVAQTTATIAGTVNPKFLASTPTVQYSTVQATVAAGSGSSTAITGPAGASVLAGDDVQAVSGSITGLSASTTYYYRVCAQSVAGNGCGSIDSFTTLPVGFTPPTVGSLTVGTPGASSASFSVAVTPGSAAATVVFQCSTSPAFTTIASSGTSPESPLTGGTSQAATGSCTSLSGSTTYYVRAVVTVSTGGNIYTYLSSTQSFTTSAAPAPSPGGGAAPAPTATPTATPAPTATLPPLTPITPSTASAPTGAVVLVNGQPQTVTVSATSNDAGLSITGTDFRMTLEGVGSSGQPLGLTPDGALILENDRFARTSGTGFMPDTPVKLYLFSEPTYVGDVLTNLQGSFNGSVQIPVTVPPGRHTLQANGYTPDGAVRSLSLPVVVKDEDRGTTATQLRTTRASVLFAPLSARLDAKAEKTLTALVRRSGKAATVTLVVGYVQKSSSSLNDVQLSTQRARAVTQFLRLSGLRGRVVVRGEGVSDRTGASARRVDVTVRAPSGVARNR